ncbi:MAG TPA: dihydrofolate reductase family protein [Candidatus Saccharimonadales bacterium]|nr:dihydrofolate reductase family protein [Candidatus Saccharimonadales bacterium]
MKVFIIAALSADGLMGQTAAQSSLDWRSHEDGVLFGRLTKEAGVLVMGSATYKTFRIKRAPPGRRLLIYTHHPETIEGEGVETTAETPRALVARLADEGYPALAIAGGATINQLFLASGVVDELYLTIEPVLFGQGVPLLAGPARTRLRLLDEQHLNDSTLLLHYAVQK